MATAAEYAEGIWRYVPRATLSGTGASATTRAQEYAVGGWSYATRSVTGAAHPPFGRTHRRRKFSGPVGDAFELNRESPQSVGLAAWWPALASRGTGAWRDLAGGNHLALNGGVSFVGDAEMGWGLGCDGTNDYAEAATTDLFESQSRGTMAAWVRFTSFASFNDIFASWIPAGNDGLLLTANSSGQLYVQRFKSAAPAVNDAYRGGTSLSTNTWYHVAVTSDGSAWQIYVNGKPETLTALGGANAGRWFSDLAAAGHAFRIGRADTTYLTGRVADLRLYNRDLSAPEIYQLYAPATRWDLYRPLKKRAIAIPLAGSGAYTLPAAGGTFALTGQNATLRSARRLPGAAGAFTLAGQSANLQVGRRLPGAVGAYTLTGYATGLRVTRRIVAGAGAFTCSGPGAGLQAARRLPAVLGTFTLTGQAATLTKAGSGAYTLSAVASAFVLGGQPAALKAARRLTAAVGTFTLTGQSANLRAGRALSGAAGNLTLAGNSAGLRVARQLAASAGALALTGQSAELKAARRLVAGVGALSLSGQSANLVRTASGAYVLTAARGALALSGQSATLRATRRLVAVVGTLTWSGNSAVLTLGVSVPPGSTLTCYGGAFEPAVTYGGGMVVAVTYGGAMEGCGNG